MLISFVVTGNNNSRARHVTFARVLLDPLGANSLRGLTLRRAILIRHAGSQGPGYVSLV